MKKNVLCVIITIILGLSFIQLFAQEEKSNKSLTEQYVLKGTFPKWIYADKNENGVVDKGDELLWPAITIGRTQITSDRYKKIVGTAYTVTECIKGSVKNNEPDTIVYYSDPNQSSYEPAIIGLIEYDKTTSGYYVTAASIYDGDGQDKKDTLRLPNDTEKRIRVAWSPQLRKDADKYAGNQVVLIGRVINDKKIGLIFGVDIVL